MKKHKTQERLSVPRIAAFFGILTMLTSGCTSIGYKTGDATSASLRKAHEAVYEETDALEATIGSLDSLVNSPASDLKPQFKTYSASLDRLIRAVDRTDKSVARLRARSADYLGAWDSELAEMNYEVIRASSEARKTAVSNQISTICRRYDETQAVVKPFVAYFSDIRRSLGSDLTAEGLASTRDVVRRAEENTRKVQSALELLSSEMRDSSVRLSSIISQNSESLSATGAGGSSSPPRTAAGIR